MKTVYEKTLPMIEILNLLADQSEVKANGDKDLAFSLLQDSLYRGMPAYELAFIVTVLVVEARHGRA